MAGLKNLLLSAALVGLTIADQVVVTKSVAEYVYPVCKTPFYNLNS